MSWKTKIEKNKLKIITGDGREYFPLWRNAQKNVNYNAKGIDFIDTEGTYVERKKTSGNQFPLNLYFVGDNCLEKSAQFEASARDSRPWTVFHPFYDVIKVQPLSMTIDNSDFNVSNIQVTVWQTLDAPYPESSANLKSEIIINKENTDDDIADTFGEEVVSPDSNLSSVSQNANDRIALNYKPLATDETDLANLLDLSRTATGAAGSLIGYPTKYIRETQNLINYPFTVSQDIETKMNVLTETTDDLIDIFIKDDSTDNELNTFSSLSASMLTQACVSAVDYDYENRASVSRSINSINDIYTTIKEKYDEILYKQNPDIALATDKIVNQTLSELYDIIFEAKQEREIILKYDSNIVMLAHKYYGPGDDNLEKFIKRNEIKRSEYLQVRKGRTIKYYV